MKTIELVTFCFFYNVRKVIHGSGQYKQHQNDFAHSTIQYDKWDGFVVILLHFKDDILVKVEKELEAYL